MHVEEKCRLFELHFEPICHEPHMIRIYISKETYSKYSSHKTRHIHAHHAHTHDLYANVYTCIHCGRTGHLAKFCYDRIYISNFTNKFVWVRKGANPHRPKKVWVPKSIPVVFDVGLVSHLT